MEKTVMKIIGVGFLVTILAVPAVVLAHGWGGGRMMRNWGMGPGYMTPYDRGYGTLTPEQRTQLEQLDRKFYEDTANLRKELWDKSYELNTVLNDENPDLEKAKALNKEINDLRTKLDDKRLDYQLEARKIIPETGFGGGYGRGFGHHGPGMMGYGRGMMGYGGPGMGGYGSGIRGYGPGTCWY